MFSFFQIWLHRVKGSSGWRNQLTSVPATQGSSGVFLLISPHILLVSTEILGGLRRLRGGFPVYGSILTSLFVSFALKVLRRVFVASIASGDLFGSHEGSIGTRLNLMLHGSNSA